MAKALISGKNNGTVAMTQAQIDALIAAAKAEGAAEAKAEIQNRPISFKVSEKKCLSVYGLGRLPVTLYAGQWLRLLEVVDQIKAFIEAHRSELAWKD